MDRISTPRGLLRLFLRFPLLLCRLGLGWLFGGRLVLVIHTGRKSGRPRSVLVEAVRLDQATHTVYILSGWGQSNWVQNIQQNPAVMVQIGWRRWPATARRLTPEEATPELLSYAQRRPAALTALAKQYATALPEALTPSETCRQLSGRIPLFALRPQSR